MTIPDLHNVGSITEVTTGVTLRGDTLRRRIAARAFVLGDTGIGAGDRVLIAHGGTAAFFVDLMAAWQCGAMAICVNPDVTDAELARVAAFSRASAVITASAAVAPRGFRRIAPPDDAEANVSNASGISPLRPDDPALVLFTSGTTADPKGVVHSAGSLFHRIGENVRQIPDGALARSLCVLPTHFGHGLIGNCLTPLLSGNELFLFCSPGLPGIARLGNVIDQNRISLMSSVPTFWKVALKAARAPLGTTLCRVHVGSAPLSARPWRAIADWTGAEVCNLYGITETANWTAGAGSGAFAPEDGLVGRMWGGAVSVRGENGVITSVGEGEILLKTLGLMSGYLDRDDLTAEVLRDGWYHTGDRGHIDETGVIRLTGRLKSEINRAGVKVMPEELDQLLEGHPRVMEACCFGMPDEILGEAVGIAVSLAKPEPAVADLREWCSDRIRSECVPEHWFVVPSIPRTDRGKLNRDRVREFCQECATT